MELSPKAIDQILQTESKDSPYYLLANRILLQSVSTGNDHTAWDFFLHHLLSGKLNPPEVNLLFPFLSHKIDVDDLSFVPADIHYFKDVYEKETAFRSQLRRYLVAQKGKMSQYQEAVCQYPGLKREYEKIPGLQGTACAGAGPKQKRQITLIPSYKCNMDCSYCVNKDLAYPDLTTAQFDLILGWLEKNGCDIISFSGGEPTFYSHFPEIIKILKNRKFEIYFATNLLFNEKALEVILYDQVSQLTAHIHPPAYFSGEQMKVFTKNLNVLHKHKKKVVFRYNISAPEDEKSWPELIGFVKEMGHAEIQFALTVPGTKGTNQFVDASSLKKMGRVGDAFLRYCSEQGMQVHVSKPIPPCCLRDDGVLAKADASICNISMTNFTRNVTVLPNLGVIPCFAVCREFKTLPEYGSWEELENDIKPYLVHLIRKQLFPECAKCYLYYNGMCMGGCLAYKAE